jgi:hypothetical protein
MVQIILWKKLIVFNLVKKVTFQNSQRRMFSIFVDPNVHRSIRKSSTLVHNVSQLNPDCILAPISLKAVSTIFHFRTGLPISSLPSRSLTTILYTFLKFPCACYVFWQPNPHWFHHSIIIKRWLPLLKFNYFTANLFPSNLGLYF